MSTLGGGCVDYQQQQAARQRQRDPARARRAAEDQVALMRDKLNVHIDPIAWRLFLRIYFRTMSTLAHTIHDNEE